MTQNLELYKKELSKKIIDINILLINVMRY